jgi:glycerophosphoryl diester phosphodiesterase
MHSSSHPALPDARPLAIAHRAGNNLELAVAAIELGVDLLETDIWNHLGQLEIRHLKTLGPIPLMWDRWYIAGFGGKRMRLSELLEGLSADARLFLDLKGQHPRLGRRIVDSIHSHHPERQILVCGRTWRQLDPIAKRPNVFVFYSVGDERQLAKVWSKLDGMAHPAISIHYRLLTEDVVARLKELETTIIAWTVNDPAIARSLFERGVDGFTSDNLDMLARIARHRERAFDDELAAELPAEPQGLVNE